MKRAVVFLCLTFFFGLSWVSVALAAPTADDLIWQYYSPTAISGISDLQTKLEGEIGKIMQAGHLAPFRALYGEGATNGGQYFWYHPYDTIYTLALAYPYVTTTTQQSIKAYVTNELKTAAYQPWSTSLLPPTTGAMRQTDQFPNGLFADEASTHYNSYNNRPKLFALYALWQYATATGDWSIVQTNSAAMSAFYNSYRANETGKFYTSIAGAIGMARVANQLGNTSLSQTAVTDAKNGMNAGSSLSTFGTNATTAYQYACGESWDYCANSMYLGFQFLDISPEIGRWFETTPALKTQVLGSTINDIYSLKRAEYRYPLWYVGNGTAETHYFGEGSGNPPDTRAMVYPLKAWVQKEPASKLRLYVNAPDALVGDYYYIQNLVRTIQAHGTECWEDVRTTTVECPQTGVSPLPTPIATLTTTIPSPTPTPVPGDINGDTHVTSADITAFINAFTSIFGYNNIVANYGR